MNTTRLAIGESGTNSAMAPAMSHAHKRTTGSNDKDSAHVPDLSMRTSPNLGILLTASVLEAD